MYHFFVEPEQIFQEYTEILGGDVNHIKNVLRMNIGEKISVSDGLGMEYLCEITSLDAQVIRAKILEKREVAVELSSSLILYQGLPKGDKMELIIQKAVELGVSRIVPVSFKRCVVKLDAKKAEAKRKRWQAIAESAAKQSGRQVIPVVDRVMTQKEALEDAKSLDVSLIPYECARDMTETKQILDGIQRGQSVGIFIGPEGGFELSEVEVAMEKGVRPITLGKRILRTETAALCMLSVLMFRLEES